jgi:hypothetical protein
MQKTLALMRRPRTMLVATVISVALAAGPAAAVLPKADRQPDPSGDVVRTYADGHMSTGYGKSDLHSVRLALAKSRGDSGKGITVTAFLDKLTPNMIRRHLRLTVWFVTDTGHVGKTVTVFSRNRATTRMEGFSADQCIPYPGLAYRRETLSIGLTNDNDCWPGATSVRARARVRYDFSAEGRARDLGPRLGPVPVPQAPSSTTVRAVPTSDDLSTVEVL